MNIFVRLADFHSKKTTKILSDNMFVVNYNHFKEKT